MSDQKTVTVIGDGGWGTALALNMLRNGHDVRLWGAFPDYVKRTQQRRENQLYLPGIKLPDGLVLTSDREEAVAESNILVIAVPTEFFLPVVESFAGLIPASCDVLTVAKGLHSGSFRRMSEVVADTLGVNGVAALSGPSHAEEVAKGMPTAVVIACRDEERVLRLQKAFMNSVFRVYTSSDVTGVELGGALKNVIAVAVGISDGIGFGDNAKAALITRGLAEITRLGCVQGAEPLTFAGLSGMGDLVVTCASGLSRNRAVGEKLGRGETIEQIRAGMKQVAEGVPNCAVARALARDLGVEVPIIEEVYKVIYEKADPMGAVSSLMQRGARAER